MIDNDDRTVGGSMDGFNTEFNEKAGWPSENDSVTEPGAASGGNMGGREGGMPEGGMPGGEMGGRDGESGGGQMPTGDSGTKLILTNGDYKGDVFNRGPAQQPSDGRRHHHECQDDRRRQGNPHRGWEAYTGDIVISPAE